MRIRGKRERGLCNLMGVLRGRNSVPNACWVARGGGGYRKGTSKHIRERGSLAAFPAQSQKGLGEKKKKALIQNSEKFTQRKSRRRREEASRQKRKKYIPARAPANPKQSENSNLHQRRRDWYAEREKLGVCGRPGGNIRRGIQAEYLGYGRFF